MLRLAVLLCLLLPAAASAAPRKVPHGLARRRRRRADDRARLRPRTSGTCWPAAAPSRCAPPSTGATSSPQRRQPTPTSRAPTPSCWPPPARPERAARAPGHAGLGGAEPWRRRLSPARSGRLCAFADRARRALRPAGLFVGGAPGGRHDGRSGLADLERAEPHPLLERRPVGSVIRVATEGRARGAAGGRPEVAHDPRRPAERELARAARDLHRRAGVARSTSWRCIRTRASPANVIKLVRFARKEMRPRGDSRIPMWVTELSWPAALGKTNTTAGFETDGSGQASRLAARARAPGARAPRAEDRARLLVHVALRRGILVQLVRLLGAAAPARRADRDRPSLAVFQARRAASRGLREAPRATPSTVA